MDKEIKEPKKDTKKVEEKVSEVKENKDNTDKKTKKDKKSKKTEKKNITPEQKQIITVIISVIAIVVILIGVMIYVNVPIVYRLPKDMKNKINSVESKISDETYIDYSYKNKRYAIIFSAKADGKFQNEIEIVKETENDGIYSIEVQLANPTKKKVRGYNVVEIPEDTQEISIYYNTNKSKDVNIEGGIEKFEGGVVTESRDGDTYYGYVNENFDEVLPTKYLDITKRYDKYLEVLEEKDDQDDNLYGVYDLSGKELIPMQYSRLEFLDENRIVVSKIDHVEEVTEEKNGSEIVSEVPKYKSAQIDVNGNILIDWIDGVVHNYMDGYASITDALTKISGNAGLVDENFNIVVNREYDYVKKLDSYYIVRKNDMIGLLDDKFNLVVPIEYSLTKEYNIETGTFEVLTKDNIEEVYYICEDETKVVYSREVNKAE